MMSKPSGRQTAGAIRPLQRGPVVAGICKFPLVVIMILITASKVKMLVKASDYPI